MVTMASVQLYEASFITSVTPSFTSGMLSLQLFLQILLNSSTDWDSLGMEESDNIWSSLSENAQDAFDYFETADKMAKRIKSQVDDELEKTVSTEKGYRSTVDELERKVRQYESRIGAKETEIQDAEKQVQNANNQLNSANVAMNAANEELSRRKRKKKKGFFGIPIIGDIAAAIAGLDGQIKHARQNAEHAQYQVQVFQSAVRERNKELGILQSELKLTRIEREQKHSELSDVNKQITELKIIQSKIAEVDKKLAKCSNFISTTFGKTRVLRDESQNAYSFEPLINTLSEIGQYLQTPSGNLDFDHKIGLALVDKRFQYLSGKMKDGRLLDEL